MAVRATGGREAKTNYTTETVFGTGAATLIECRLETGRTHQIRVHLAHIKHPVLGDPVYGGGATKSRKAAIGEDAAAAVEALGRQALHARLLGFDHPITGEPLRFESDLPPDLADLTRILGTSGNTG